MRRVLLHGCLLIVYLLLQSTFVAHAQYAEPKSEPEPKPEGGPEFNDDYEQGRSRPDDYHSNHGGSHNNMSGGRAGGGRAGGGNKFHTELEPFNKPGVIVPGLKVRDIIEVLANAYGADTIKESAAEGCRILGPIVQKHLGDEIYEMTQCRDILDSLESGTRINTAEMCMQMAEMMTEEMHHEDPYGEYGMGNPGFDNQHEDGLHFNYYDQHQEMYADFPGGGSAAGGQFDMNNPYHDHSAMPEPESEPEPEFGAQYNSYNNKGGSQYHQGGSQYHQGGPPPGFNNNTGGVWISPGDVIMFYTSMILSPAFPQEFPHDMVRNMVHEIFETDPTNPSEVCTTAETAMFDDSRTAQYWFEDFVERYIRLMGRLTPWTCSAIVSSHDRFKRQASMDYQHNGGPGGGSYGGMSNDYQYDGNGGPQVHPGEIIGRVFSYLGNFESVEELCMTTVEAVENSNANPDAFEETVSSMKNTLFSIVQDQGSCVSAFNFVNELMSGFGFEGSFVEMLGFENDDSMCQFVVDSFSSGSSADDPIDITAFLPREYPNYNDYQQWQSHQTHSPPAPPPIRELLQIAGRLYTANTLQEGLSSFCDTFDQTGQIYEILGQSGGDLCARGRAMGEFHDLCMSQLSGFNNHHDDYGGPDEHYTEHGGSDHGHDSGMMNFFYSHDGPFHGMFKVLATRYGLFDVMNPYSDCDAGVDIVTTPMDELINLAKDTAAKMFVNFLQKEYPMMLCAMHDNAASGHGDDTIMPESMHYDHNYEGFDEQMHVDPTVEQLLQIVAILADVNDHAAFCQLIQHNEDRASDSEHREMLTDLASSMMDVAFDVVEDVDTCTSIVEIGRGMSQDMFSHITGKSSANDFCRMLVNAFSARNSASFQPPRMPSLSSIMESQEEPFQSPGKIFSFLSIEDIIKTFGKLYNQENPLGSARVMCNSYGKILAEIPEVGEHISGMCSAIENGNDDDLAWECYTHLVPAMFGPEHPIALRTYNAPYELMKILLPMVDHPIFLDAENLCSAEEAFLNSDLSIEETVDVVLDEVLRFGITYANGICNDMDNVRRYLAPKREHSCYIDYNGHDLAWNGMPCDEFIAQEMETFDYVYNGMFKIISFATGLRNEKFFCGAMREAADARDSNIFDALVDTIKERLYSFLFDGKQCTALANRIQSFAKHFVPEEELHQMLHQITGFRTPQALCATSSRLFRGEKVVGKCQEILLPDTI